MRKSKLDVRINELILKYNIDELYPEFRTSILATEYLIDYLQYYIYRKVLVVGSDIAGLRYLQQNVSYDSWTFLHIKESDLLKDVETGDYDLVLVVSYWGSNTIVEYFTINKIDFIWVYDLLYENGIELHNEFYAFYEPHKIDAWAKTHNAENSIWESSLLYELARINSYCEDVRKRFFICICLRDFYTAKNLLSAIEENRYVDFMHEVDVLLNEVKLLLSSNVQRHIITYWIDSVSYNKSFEMNYLQRIKEKAVFFTNAYANTPWTNATLRSIFCGLRQRTDNGYEVNYIDASNSKLIRFLNDKNYKLKIVGGCFNEKFDKRIVNKSRSRNDCVTTVLWDLLTDILSACEDTVHFAHILNETHGPYISIDSTFCNKTGNYYKEELSKGRKYVDQQLEFYDGIFGESTCKIYMSDHGWNFEDRFHVMLQIVGRTITPKAISKMYCHLDFYKIIENIINCGDVNDNDFERSFVPIEDIDYYAIDLKKILLKKNLAFINYFYFYGYKGAIVYDDVFIHFNDGKEVLGKVDNLQVGNVLQINNNNDDDRFGYYKSLIIDISTDYRNDSKFYTFNLANQLASQIKVSLRSVVEIINKIISMYGDNSIAIRMGGQHTIRMVEILTNENRKKISCIVDCNEQCACRELGYEIINSYHELPQNVTAVILSSFYNLEDLRLEVQQYLIRYEVIDLYYILEKYGYKYESEFFNGCVEDYCHYCESYSDKEEKTKGIKRLL